MLHCGVLYCRRVSLALRNRCYLITFFKHAGGSPAWSHHPLVCLSLLTNHFLSSPTHTLSSTFLCIKISIIKICSKSVDTPQSKRSNVFFVTSLIYVLLFRLCCLVTHILSCHLQYLGIDNFSSIILHLCIIAQSTTVLYAILSPIIKNLSLVIRTIL